MSKASDTILKDLFPLYEKWLNQDGISIQQVGLTCLGSAIACLQQAGYSPNEIAHSAIMSIIPRGAKVEYRDTDGNSKKPLNPQEVKIVTDCPKCGNISVVARELGEGGGVVCTTKDCGYWFCY